MAGLNCSLLKSTLCCCVYLNRGEHGTQLRASDSIGLRPALHLAKGYNIFDTVIIKGLSYICCHITM